VAEGARRLDLDGYDPLAALDHAPDTTTTRNVSRRRQTTSVAWRGSTFIPCILHGPW
jgi:hypothetical protein